MKGWRDAALGRPARGMREAAARRGGAGRRMVPGEAPPPNPVGGVAPYPVARRRPGGRYA